MSKFRHQKLEMVFAYCKTFQNKKKKRLDILVFTLTIAFVLL